MDFSLVSTHEKTPQNNSSSPEYKITVMYLNEVGQNLSLDVI